ncbi:Phage integrase family protein [compost metagenome]
MQTSNANSESYQRSEFISKDGYHVEIGSNYWRLDKDSAFKLSSLSSLLSPEVNKNFRQVLAFFGETYSARYTETLYRHFRVYVEGTSNQPIFSPESIITHRSNLAGCEWGLSLLRPLFRTWISLGYPGVPVETLKMMEGWRIKGYEKGYSVQSMCPDRGPFTDIEMQGIVSKVIECYVGGRIGLTDTCYAMILSMTGRRPVQITALKLKDLVVTEGRYFISFPRVKQRKSEWRGSFSKFQIVDDLWTLLQAQAGNVKAAFEECIKAPITRDLALELPLFPNLKNFDANETLSSQLSGDYLHARTSQVGYALAKVQDVIGVISERTMAVINIAPCRFRYTLGTNLAREGHGVYVIAEALDHSDTQNAGVYVRNIPEIVERIDKAIALQLAPLAQAFQGVLVIDETKARRGEDRSSRIYSADGSVGTCGNYGFCGALAPVGCYTCAHFQPWLDGPHEFILDQLITERDNVFASTGDLKIASVNDRLILAVSDVCARCKAMKSGLADD